MDKFVETGVAEEAPPPRLAVIASWTLLGNATYAAFEWGVVLILARLTEPEVLGSYGVAIGLCSPLFLFFNMGLRTVTATDAAGRWPYSQLLRFRMASTAIACLVIGCVAALWFRPHLYTIALVALVKAGEATSDLAYGQMQQLERMGVIARSLMLRGTLAFVGFAVALAISGRLHQALVLRVVVFILLSLFDVAAASRYAQKLLQTPGAVSTLLSVGIPLGFVAGLDSLTINLPRLFLERYRTSAEVGHFSAIALTLMIGGTVIGAIGNSAAPRLSRLYLTNIDAFAVLTRRLSVVAGGLGLAAVVMAAIAGRPLLRLVYGPAYEHLNRPLVWLAAGGALWFVTTGYSFALYAAQSYRGQLLPYLVMTGAGAFTAFALVPAQGVTGACVAYLVAMASRLCATLALYQYVMRSATCRQT